MKQLLVFFIFLLPWITWAQTDAMKNSKLAVYWTKPYMSRQEAEELSNYDVVIADLENALNNKSELDYIRQHATKLICYSNPMELFDPMPARRQIQTYILSEIKNQYDKWWLRQPDGKQVVFWSKMRMLNLSTNCPVVNGLKYNEFIAKVTLKVLNSYPWDGYFMDNCTPNIAWVGSYNDNHGIDSNLDGVWDDDAMLDTAWYYGVRDFLKIIRNAKGDDFIMLGNKGTTEYADILNGRMFEDFPNDYLGEKTAYGWFQCMRNAEKNGPYTIFHTKKNPKFVYASSLLLDNVYFCYKDNYCDPLPDLYKDLGTPLSSAYKDEDGNFVRNFSRGKVIVRPYEQTADIILNY